MTTFSCAQCGVGLPLMAHDAGKTVRCPQCDRITSPLPVTVLQENATEAAPPFTVDHVSQEEGIATTDDLAAPTKTRKARPTVAVPGYELLGELGRGGMGVVYKARQTALNRIVALKMILAGGHAGPLEIARFKSEALSIARLQHPHIVQLFEVGEADGHPYCTLEFVGGGNLAHESAGTPQPVRRAAELVRTLAEAMHVAHQAGVIHRDLKPANVLLTEAGAPKITDFGLAKQLDAAVGQTRSGDVFGTPSYMAPEQARGDVHGVGPAADIYALGAILYDLLTGRPPFKGESAVDTVLQVIHDEPVSPRQLQPKVPRDLETICLKCLHKDARRRYASAQELADDLGRFLRTEPIRARPVGRLARFARWCRREPRVAGALLLVCLTVATAFALITLSRNDALKSAAEAREQARQVRRQRAGDAFQEAYRRLQMDRAQGMLLLARSLGLAVEAEDMDLETTIRTHLTAWGHDTPTLQGAVRVQRGHDTRQAGFGADGKTFFLTGMAGIMEVYDTASVQEMSSISPISDTTYRTHSFSSDGTVALVDAADGTVRLWDRVTGKPLGPPLKHAARVDHLCLSPDGRTGLTCCIDGTVRVWDARRGTLEWPVIPGLRNVTVAAFRPAVPMIFLECSRGAGLLVKKPDQSVDLRPLEGAGHIGVAAFHPKDNMLVTAGMDGSFSVWETGQGRLIRTIAAHQDGIKAVAFSHTGWQMATGGFDRTVRRWNWSLEALGPPLYHEATVHAIAFSPDTRLLLVSCVDHTARLWSLPSIEKHILALDNAFESSRHAALSPDGRYWCLGTPEGTVRRWDTKTGRVVGRDVRHPAALTELALARDGRTILTGGEDGTARVWDGDTGQPLSPPVKHEGVLTYAAFHPDGRAVLTASVRQDARAWDVATGRPLGPPLPGTAGYGRAVYSPDGTDLLIVQDFQARLWDPARSEPFGLIFRHHMAIETVSFSPDGKRFVTAGSDHTARVWDRATFKAVSPPLLHPHNVLAAAISPDNRLLLTVCDRFEVCLWEIDSGKLLGPLVSGHMNQGKAVFAADGRSVLLAGLDGRIETIPIPVPRRGSWERITLDLEAALGMELDETGGARILDADAWQARRLALQEAPAESVP